MEILTKRKIPSAANSCEATDDKNLHFSLSLSLSLSLLASLLQFFGNFLWYLWFLKIRLAVSRLESHRIQRIKQSTKVFSLHGAWEQRARKETSRECTFRFGDSPIVSNNFSVRRTRAFQHRQCIGRRARATIGTTTINFTCGRVDPS